MIKYEVCLCRWFAVLKLVRLQSNPTFRSCTVMFKSDEISPPKAIHLVPLLEGSFLCSGWFKTNRVKTQHFLWEREVSGGTQDTQEQDKQHLIGCVCVGVWLCVCVCVMDRKRGERQRKTDIDRKSLKVHLSVFSYDCTIFWLMSSPYNLVYCYLLIITNP